LRAARHQIKDLASPETGTLKFNFGVSILLGEGSGVVCTRREVGGRECSPVCKVGGGMRVRERKAYSGTIP